MDPWRRQSLVFPAAWARNEASRLHAVRWFLVFLFHAVGLERTSHLLPLRFYFHARGLLHACSCDRPCFFRRRCSHELRRGVRHARVVGRRLAYDSSVVVVLSTASLELRLVSRLANAKEESCSMAASPRTCVDVVLLRHGLVVRDDGGGFGSARPTYVVVGDARRVCVRRTTLFQDKDAWDRVACRTRRGSCCHRRWRTCGWESKDGPRWTSIVRVVRRRWDVPTPSSFRVCPDRPTSAPHVAKLWVGYEAWMARRRRRHPSGERKKERKEERKERGRWNRGTTTCRVHVEIQPPTNRKPWTRIVRPWSKGGAGWGVSSYQERRGMHGFPTCFLDLAWAPSSTSHPTKRHRCSPMHMHVPRPNAVHVANADRGREEETSDMQKPNETATTTTKLMPRTSWKTNTRDAKHAGPKNGGRKKICAWAG